MKSQGSNLGIFSFMKPQSMKESNERRNRKTKSKKGKHTKKVAYDQIKDKLFDGYNPKRTRAKNEALSKFNSFGINKKSSYNIPITTSNRKKMDQNKSFIQDPAKKMIHNRKLINSNFKEVKKLLTNNKDIDIKEFLFKKLVNPIDNNQYVFQKN